MAYPIKIALSPESQPVVIKTNPSAPIDGRLIAVHNELRASSPYQTDGRTLVFGDVLLDVDSATAVQEAYLAGDYKLALLMFGIGVTETSAKDLDKDERQWLEEIKELIYLLDPEVVSGTRQDLRNCSVVYSKLTEQLQRKVT